MKRRDFLKTLGGVALLPAACARMPVARGSVVNDVHAQLNATRVARVLVPDSVAAIQRVVREADRLCIAGGRHAMGGQQFCEGATLLDTTGFNRVLAFDAEAGTIEVEAGIQWPALVEFLAKTQVGETRALGIIQKQTGADRLCMGGALAANIHGRGLGKRPFIQDVAAFTLVDAEGNLIACSRDKNKELFRLVIGGYGLFGVVYSVTLRLQPRQPMRRVVEIRRIEDVMAGFEARIADGFEYGDFQYSVDSASEGFLRDGVFSCYQPVAGEVAGVQHRKHMTDANWRDMLRDAHFDKARAYRLYTGYYLSTNGQIYEADEHQMSIYPDGYHLALDRDSGTGYPGSEMITEIYVPRGELAAFMGEAADDFRRNQVNVIYGTVRLIEKDEESFLAWAKRNYACIIFNLHVEHSPAGLELAAGNFRRLIDMAIRRDGSYYLTYHRWATREQVLACYPQFPEFLRLKQQYDPGERFQSDWYRHCKALLEG